MTTRYRYRQPINEDEFEEFCLVLLREVRNRPDFKRYGHRGEDQYGVDIIDESGVAPLIAVQCKHHAIDKTLPPSELKAEVEAALQFPHQIDEYYVLTTAKKSGRAQDTVRAINREHLASGCFKVQLLTWDEIERLIDQSPAARQFLGLDPTDATTKAVQLAVAPILAHVESSGSVVNSAHADLDEIKSCLDRGDPTGADFLARRLKDRSWIDLSNGQRWRLCTFWADAKLRESQNSDATNLLLEALTNAPDSEHAVTNAIRALRMNDDSVGARQKAKGALEKFPKSAAVLGELIELAETTDEARAYLAAVPDEARGAVEILIAVATRYEFAESEAAARDVVEKYPEVASAWHVRGKWLLDHELQKISPVESGPAAAPRRERFVEAIAAFTKVSELAQRDGHRALEADALTRRAGAYGQLEDWESAARDNERALELAPRNQQVLLDAARIAEAQSDTEGMVRYLRKAGAVRESAQIWFFLGVALWNRKKPGDREEAISLLAAAASRQDPYAEPALEMAVEGHLLHGNPDAAAELVERAAPNVDAVTVLAHQSRLAKFRGIADDAERLASEAIAGLSAETSRETRRVLAKNLMYLGRFGDALAILQDLAVPGVTDESGRRLIDCATRIDNQAVVLDYCAKARAAGVFDPHLLERELWLLERYHPAKAVELLQEIVRRDPTDHVARVNLAVIALRENRLDMLREQVPLLPGVEEVGAWEGARVVAILREVGRFDEAIKYAYDLLRRNFGDHHAHRAYRNVFVFHRTEDPILEYEEVIPGAAVELTEKGHTKGHWFIIEDSKVEAKDVPDEIRPESPHAQRLMGKRLGDEVNLTDAPGFARPHKVTAIVPKRVYRLRDVFDQWQMRFPEHQEVLQQQFETVDGETDFGPLFEWADSRRRTQEELLEAFRMSPETIHVLAEVSGINEVDALWQLAHREGTPIRCCMGTEQAIARNICIGSRHRGGARSECHRDPVDAWLPRRRDASWQGAGRFSDNDGDDEAPRVNVTIPTWLGIDP